MKKLWGGRFKENMDPQFRKFNASLPVDWRLLEADIQVNKAYAQALRKAGILTGHEEKSIQSALDNIREKNSKNPTHILKNIEQGIEDIHTYVETEVIKSAGEAGYKIHTGRSRNEQVSTDLRIYLRQEILSLQKSLKNLCFILIGLAEQNFDVIMPGYTHLQKAQPVLFPHYLMAYFEKFCRDIQRLDEVFTRTNVLPLGSGALTGSHTKIDRNFLCKLLGFAEISSNSMDAVSDRDFILDFTGAGSIILIHLSRLAEDLILYSSSEFGFIELRDNVATGSSLMPHKKNPDALELIRGKTGQAFGHHMGMLALMKGLPLTYNKDLQESQNHLFESADIASTCVSMMATILKNIILHKERIRQSAQSDYIDATEVVDYLIRKGLPFRKAHHIAGKVVLFGIEAGLPLHKIKLKDFHRFSPLFDKDVYDIFSLEKIISAKDIPGGTSPERVKEAIRQSKKKLE
jgi:argininosuccinate lyase